MRQLNYIFFALCAFSFSCSDKSKSEVNKQLASEIKELTDVQYPDNPDIEIRSDLDGIYSHKHVELRLNEDSTLLDFLFVPGNALSDSIFVNQVRIEEFIPFFPTTIDDDYLNQIGVINQEWNRQQVKFLAGQFEVGKLNGEGTKIKRVDIARNCLNAYLWEVIIYLEEGGRLKPYYHGWFDFPHELYQDLFNKRNQFNWKHYDEHLVNWIDPDSKLINYQKIRHIDEELQVNFEVLNHLYYPLIGERKKKFKNIIYPRNPSCINDFLTDSTLYGTFTPPGFYNTSDPRVTQLGRLSHVDSLQVKKVSSAFTDDKDLLEISILYSDSNRSTRLVIGGIDQSKIPTLKRSKMDKGYQMPMGIANHSFYEDYKTMLANKSQENPFYAFFTDKSGKWLDSHKIGVDGPLMYFDAEDPEVLHLWLLSFERHSFVGHYLIKL